jgi:putative oxidoreductase
MSADLSTSLIVIGRALLGVVFVLAGVRHFFILPILTGVLNSRGVPAARAVLLLGSLFQIIAGCLLAFGWCVFWAALGLILFTIAATVLLVNFWSMEGEQRESARSAAMANLAIVGGLLLAAAQAQK